ncbi:hypothetical protein IAD21_00564 [Abditibacteriota bacterium]|nr:hypothetical protein IAD21_00564 [Abditibacteriota bacterium]
MPSNSILLVEGVNDAHVFFNLFDRHSISFDKPPMKGQPSVEGKFSVKPQDGIETLLKNLGVQIKASERENIGIVVDADEDPQSRWNALSNILRKAGYKNIPSSAVSGGAIIHEEGLPSIGIWVMPDNSLLGMLEHFVASMVSGSDPLWIHAQNVVNNIQISDRKFSNRHVMKAQIHTWLAWQEVPGIPMGAAIKATFLDANTPLASQFISWVKTLFNC